MDRKITVHTSPQTRVPVAAVPLRHLWDLVEYLAYRRTRVQYNYGATHCVVHFPHIDRAAAQRILNEWAQSGAALVPGDDAMKRKEGEVVMSF